MRNGGEAEHLHGERPIAGGQGEFVAALLVGYRFELLLSLIGGDHRAGDGDVAGADKAGRLSMERGGYQGKGKDQSHRK